MMENPNKRYTPKHSTRALWQSWRTRNPNDKHLNDIGRRLAVAAHRGYEEFDQLCRELRPEL